MNLIKKIILFIICRLNKQYNRILLQYKNVSFIEFPYINGRLIIVGSGKILLGKNVKINSSLLSNPIGGETKTIFSVDKDAMLKIGNDTGLSNCSIVCKEKVIIGNNVKIGGGVKIFDTDFHSTIYEHRIYSDTDIPISKSIEIKDGVFIGAFTVILKGVIIGEKSIIGAGSIVTRSVPNGEIWGGNPAKFIKRVDE